MAPQQLERSRAEFEGEFKKQYPHHLEIWPEWLDKTSDGEYIHEIPRWGFQFWIARHESIVVELPFEIDENGNHEVFWRKSTVINAMLSAGINYRERE